MDASNSILTDALDAARRGAQSEEMYEEILKQILHHTAFRELPISERPNPFDDPYVGAVLTSDKLELLGSHRKKTNQERHAEPNAILAALQRVADCSHVAQKTLEQINTIYDEKSWLSGDAKVRQFESLFKDAGDIIRSHFNCGNLYVFSSLEPCKDYESQPSCACIICSTGVSHVFYASDDTNAKGQGRAILETGSDARGRVVTAEPPKVRANLAIDEAISTNRLFFTTHDIISRMFNTLSISPNGSTPTYSTFRLDHDYIRPNIVNSRLVLVQKENSTLPVYQSPIRQFGISNDVHEGFDPSSAKLAKISHAKRDDELALLSRSSAEADLIDIFFGRVSHDLPLPGTLIFTRDPNFSDQTREILQHIGIKPYYNAFRKHDEHFKAKQHVALSIVKPELTLSIYIVVKSSAVDGDSEPYLTYFGKVDDCRNFLETKVGGASRVSLFSAAANRQECCSLLDALSDRGHFGRAGKFSNTSFELRFCRMGERAHDDIGSATVDSTIKKLRLINRVKIFDEPVNALLSADNVASMVRESGVDPTFLSPKFLADLTGSLNWRDRRSAGAMLAEMLSREPSMLESLILPEIDAILEDEVQGTSWAQLCTYLNAIQDVSGHEVHENRSTVLPILKATGIAIENQLSKSAVVPWLIDVTWRWLACWAKYARDYETFSNALLRTHTWAYISSSPFLLSQLAYYTVSSRKSIDGVQYFIDLLASHHQPLDFAAAEATSVMCARLAFALHVVDGIEAANELRTCIQFSKPAILSIFDAEFERCQLAWHDRLSAVEAATEREIGRTFATLTNLRALIPAVSRRNENVTAKDAVGHVQTWRGDQIGTVYDALLQLGPSKMVSAIEGLVTDTDVSTRWAGLLCTLGPKSAALCASIAPSNGRGELHNLREIRRKFVKSALSVDSHYWLEREILGAYADLVDGRRTSEATPIDTTSGIGMPSLSSLDLDETILRPGDIMHPEVLKEQERYTSNSLKIALVLPPIHQPHDGPVNRNGVVNEGSPPLGLGQIATSLSARGHFAKVIDAHRYSIGHNDLIKHLSEFDVVGFGVVISTMESTRTIINDLRSLDDGPHIVLGGHAPTLLGSAGMDGAGLAYDYLVVGAGEDPFLAIVQTLLSSEPANHQIHPQVITRASVLAQGEDGVPRGPIGPTARAMHAAAYEQFWRQAPWIEREHFADPITGVAYEPSPTRDGRHTEGHVVVSRGCNWGCTFCTEALIGGTHGEVRRDVADVLGEVRWLAERHGVNRVQFVDDNILPSNPKFETGKANRNGDWAMDFLRGLEDMRQSSDSFFDLHWRGLMRIEDLVAYRDNVDDFSNHLKKSGCNLLAFGIEAGNDEKRHKMKGGVKNKSTNKVINDVIRELRSKDIFTKGYFILGGPDQNASDCLKTIEYACESDVDLAYFAIYKDFRGLIKDRSQRRGIPKFGLFISGLDGALSGKFDEQMWQDVLGPLDDLNTASIQTEYEKLSALGFSFKKVIKYNDFQLDEAEYEKMEFKDHTQYLQMLSRAYTIFYCRPGWSDRYAALLDSGY